MAKTWRQRIYDMLELSLSQRPTNLEAFREAIPNMNVVPSSFVYRRCNKEGVYRDVCSPGAVSYAAKLCVDLGLIDGVTGKVTPVGRRGSNAVAFDDVLASQIWAALSKEFGVSRTRLADVIRGILQARIPDLPTAEKIWSDLGEPGDLVRFKRLLHILGRCGGLQVSQRPTYLMASPRRTG